MELKKNGLEWGVFGFGIFAIGLIVVGLVRDAGTPATPPDLRLEVGKSVKVGERWLVPVTVSNVGGEAVQSVAVRGKAGEQEAEFDLEYVPRESLREGRLIFRDEPLGLKVDLSGAASP